MLDAKVLAAVFASLTAVATAMNGGGFQPDMAVEGVSSGEINLPDFADSGSTLNQLRDLLTSRPEPTNNIQATIEIGDLDDEEINLQNSTIYVSGLRKVKLGSNTMSSDEDITFKGLKGNINFDDIATIQGSASSITSSGVNFSGSVNVNEEVNSSSIVIKEKGRSKVSFSDIEADIEYENKSEQTLDTEKFSIDSFTGKTTVYLENNTVVLDGKVNSLTAGEFSYGG